MLQGRQWEESGEYQRAVECYLKIDALATRLFLFFLLSAFVVVVVVVLLGDNVVRWC